MSETSLKNPGSPEAHAAGCRCPILDNNHGKGFGPAGAPRFWISGDCKLHGQANRCAADPQKDYGHDCAQSGCTGGEKA